MNCRGCDSVLEDRGQIYVGGGVEWVDLYKCGDCGVINVPRCATVYEELHADESSSYARHRQQNGRIAELLNAGQHEDIRKLVVTSGKMAWAADEVSKLPSPSKILEIGCSSGAFGAYCLSLGHDYRGVDISPTAVKTACAYFGNHFVLSNSKQELSWSSLDQVVILGTIGCADEPVKLLESVLARLKPGGKVIFNAPNSVLMEKEERVWSYSTCPPDHVTVFPNNFWSTRFQKLGKVTVEYQMSTLRQSRRQRRIRQCLLNDLEKRRSSVVTEVGRLGRLAGDLLLMGVSKYGGLNQDYLTVAEYGVLVTIEKG